MFDGAEFGGQKFRVCPSQGEGSGVDRGAGEVVSRLRTLSMQCRATRHSTAPLLYCRCTLELGSGVLRLPDRLVTFTYTHAAPYRCSLQRDEETWEGLSAVHASRFTLASWCAVQGMMGQMISIYAVSLWDARFAGKWHVEVVAMVQAHRLSAQSLESLTSILR